MEIETLKNVNILLSTYNGESFLAEQLDSLVNQTYPNITIYIRDDGSKDRTLDIINNYQELTRENSSGKKIILIESQKENLGYCRSFARLCTLVPPADFYAFCDQDDVWRKDKIERAVSALNNEDPNELLLYSHSYHICNMKLEVQKENVIYHPSLIKNSGKVEFPKALMMGDWFGQGFTQVFNHRLKEVAFPKEIGIDVSHDVWTSWVIGGFQGKFIYDTQPLVYYRRHDKATSAGSTGILNIYKKRIQNCNQLCAGIHSAIAIYNERYYDLLSDKNRKLLDIFTSRNQIKKAFYTKRYRDKVIDECAFRCLMIIGKL